jgi:hypothetical protein
MGAMKNLFIEATDATWQISNLLRDASETGDLDDLKLALRSAIANSALTLAFIAEIEAK